MPKIRPCSTIVMIKSITFFLRFYLALGNLGKCFHCTVVHAVRNCDSKIFCYFFVYIQVTFCQQLVFHIFCFYFSLQDFRCHLTSVFSKADIVDSFCRQTSDLHLFDFTSEYRNPFFVCLIQNRRERANHRVICQVGQAVYFRQQICGCKRNLGAAGDSCGLQGNT